MKKTFRKIWKSFWEPVLKLPIMQWVVAILMAAAIWLVYYTSWKKVTGKEILREYRRKPAIFVLWHGRSMMASPIVRRYGIRGYAVASRHRDGRMMAKLQRTFGLKPIFGSTSEGGISVLRQGVKKLRDGGNVLSLSPDGPGGPSLRVQDGALYFAKMTGAPIIPVCYSCSRAWFQDRWDRYLVAPPFSRITCDFGKPFFVDSKINKEEFEEARKKLEDFMVKQLRRMDAFFNLPKVEQDQNARDYKKNKRENKKK
ncbi:MAG: lysophospholipid acyltransferase family protein [Alphaproteobacteria bacterium]|nr:lysophospholipid acyltransferase family protein [Alphaproteobacteria bacterium]MBN2674955.1 lysophospholipid acyltransferase family protein [Alphaproteobacteria bacterium]